MINFNNQSRKSFSKDAILFWNQNKDVFIILTTLLKKYFSCKGRINRKQFAKSMIIVSIIDLALNVVSFFLTLHFDNTFAILTISILSMLPNLSILSLIVRRLYDLDKPAWPVLALILILIPMLFTGILSCFISSSATFFKTPFYSALTSFYGIVFLAYLTIKKGTPGKNKYDIDVQYILIMGINILIMQQLCSIY